MDPNAPRRRPPIPSGRTPSLTRDTLVMPEPWQPFLDYFRPEEITWGAIRPGLTRYPRALFWALAGSWTLLALAIWIGVLVAIIGAVIGFFGLANVGNYYLAGSGSAVGVIGAILGAFAGFGVGFAAVMGTDLITGAERIAVSIACGAALAAVATAFLMFIEPWSLYLRGYRGPSDREKDGLQPVLDAVAGTMGLSTVPDILISDTPTDLDAQAYTRHVVITKPMLKQPAEQLAGILVHEFTHWRNGDTVGLLFVSMCGLPLTLTITFIAYLGRVQHRAVQALATLVGWPFLVITKLMLEPALARDGRDYEYAADAAAVKAGYGPGLYTALEYLAAKEPVRSGWRDVVNATHPPIEYRLEAIEDALKAGEGVRPRQHAYHKTGVMRALIIKGRRRDKQAAAMASDGPGDTN